MRACNLRRAEERTDGGGPTARGARQAGPTCTGQGQLSWLWGPSSWPLQPGSSTRSQGGVWAQLPGLHHPRKGRKSLQSQPPGRSLHPGWVLLHVWARGQLPCTLSCPGPSHTAAGRSQPRRPRTLSAPASGRPTEGHESPAEQRARQGREGRHHKAEGGSVWHRSFQRPRCSAQGGKDERRK